MNARLPQRVSTSGRWRRLHWPILLGAAVAGAILLLTACDEEAKVQQVAVTAQDYSFQAPAQVQAGLVTVTMENKGKESHHAQMARLNDGVTLPQLQQALQQNPNAALGMLEFVGGAGTQPAGQRGSATMKLREGQHLFLCFVPTADGVPHLAKGMVQPFQVTASTAKAPKDPKTDAEVVLRDFAFQAPKSIKAGARVIKITNSGKEPHEMGLIRIQTGKTFQDVGAWAQKPQGPPPFVEAGGFQAIGPNGTGWANVNVTKGDYGLLCFVPSPANQGKPHVALGMALPLPVE